jgi:flavodoxin
MKILTAYYSRTGNTRVVAQKIAEITKSDIEEIKDTKNRSGFFGFLVSGYEAARKKTTKIAELKYDPLNYDIVIIGTPVWAGKMSVPIRTYILNNKDKFDKVAFFCTFSFSPSNIFKDMEEACNKKPIIKEAFRDSEIKSGKYIEKLNIFRTLISNNS